MSNPTKQLTVSDLEAAKHGLLNHTNLTSSDIDIAATCIGIVEEMVKCAKPKGGVLCEYCTKPSKTFPGISIIPNLGIYAMNTIYTEDANHIVALHNLWLKAFAAFGGEVK